jgi:hypothetical protein
VGRRRRGFSCPRSGTSARYDLDLLAVSRPARGRGTLRRPPRRVWNAGSDPPSPSYTACLSVDHLGPAPRSPEPSDRIVGKALARDSSRHGVHASQGVCGPVMAFHLRTVSEVSARSVLPKLCYAFSDAHWRQERAARAQIGALREGGCRPAYKAPLAPRWPLRGSPNVTSPWSQVDLGRLAGRGVIRSWRGTTCVQVTGLRPIAPASFSTRRRRARAYLGACFRTGGGSGVRDHHGGHLPRGTGLLGHGLRTGDGVGPQRQDYKTKGVVR